MSQQAEPFPRIFLIEIRGVENCKLAISITHSSYGRATISLSWISGGQKLKFLVKELTSEIDYGLICKTL